jgi:hypothetical protein
VLAEAAFVEAVGHAIAGRWAAMEEALGRAQGFDRPEADTVCEVPRTDDHALAAECQPSVR